MAAWCRVFSCVNIASSRVYGPQRLNLARWQYMLNSTLATEFKKATAGAPIRPLCRTSEVDPAHHSRRHEGFFYTVSKDDFERWMSRGLRTQYYRAMQGFTETCLMVREPAVEIIGTMKAADYSAPSIRYVLYGREGCGKSTTMAHVSHFCGREGWLIAHLPWAPFYNRYFREVQPSAYKPGRLDQPLEAADWLNYFRKMNEPLLTSSSCPVTAVDKYVWSKRETTEVGTPLSELIDFGLARVKFSCDVMGVVLKELRSQASAGNFRLLVAIDGINAFWGSTLIKREENRSTRHMSTDLTLTQHWLSMVQDNWSGGAVLCTLDTYAAYPVKHSSYMPLELLGSDGFQYLDPFLPVCVPAYNDREIFSCIEYYRDRRWIQNEHGGTEEGRKELMALSANNPLELYRVTVNW